MCFQRPRKVEVCYNSVITSDSPKIAGTLPYMRLLVGLKLALFKSCKCMCNSVCMFSQYNP